MELSDAAARLLVEASRDPDHLIRIPGPFGKCRVSSNDMTSAGFFQDEGKGSLYRLTPMGRREAAAAR